MPLYLLEQPPAVQDATEFAERLMREYFTSSGYQAIAKPEAPPARNAGHWEHSNYRATNEYGGIVSPAERATTEEPPKRGRLGRIFGGSGSGGKPLDPTQQEMEAKAAIFTPDRVQRACELIDAARPIAAAATEQQLKQWGGNYDSLTHDQLFHIGRMENVGDALWEMKHYLGEGTGDIVRINPRQLWRKVP